MIRKRQIAVWMLFFLLIAGVFSAPAVCYGETEPVYGKEINDGTYSVEVESNSSMFRIVNAELTVKGGEMSAVVTLGGKGYLMLFMGTGEEAIAASESKYVPFTEDEEGAYTYEIAVAALNTELECTGFSKRKQKWYDHQIIVKADTLPQEAWLDTHKEKNILNAEEPEAKNLESEAQEPDESRLANRNYYDVTEVEQADRNMAARLELTNERNPVATGLDLADGNYRVAVELSGGTGRAEIVSPAQLVVEENRGTIFLEWSSPFYDYMILNGEKFLPVNQDGNSCFALPLVSLNQEITVIADTTAMGQPHEIEYVLVFDGQSIKMDTEEMKEMPQEDGEQDSRLGMIMIIAVLVGAGGGIGWYKIRNGK